MSLSDEVRQILSNATQVNIDGKSLLFVCMPAADVEDLEAMREIIDEAGVTSEVLLSNAHIELLALNPPPGSHVFVSHPWMGIVDRDALDDLMGRYAERRGNDFTWDVCPWVPEHRVASTWYAVEKSVSRSDDSSE